MKVFISYSHKDVTFARKLRRDLEALGFSVWMDEKDVKVGSSFTKKIEEGINYAEYVIVVISPDSVESGWVELEWTSSLISHITGKGIKVLPVLYRDAEIPLFLQGFLYANAEQDYDLALARLVQAMQKDTTPPYELFDDNNSLEKKYSFTELMEQSDQELAFCGFTLAGSLFSYDDYDIAKWINNSKKFEVFIAKPEHETHDEFKTLNEFYKRKFSYYQLDGVLLHLEQVRELLDEQNRSKFQVYLLDLPRVNLLNLKRVGGFWFCRLIGFNQMSKISPVMVVPTSSPTNKFFENYINNLRTYDEFREVMYPD